MRHFGANSEVDSYFIAISIIQMIITLIQSGYLSEVFLPIYVDAKKKSRIDAQLIFFSIIHRVIFFLTLLTFIFWYLAPSIFNFIGSGLNIEQKLLGSKILRYTSFLVLLTTIESFFISVLTAEKVYGRSEITHLVNSISSITIFILLKSHLGIYTLVLSLLFGKIMSIIISIIFFRMIGIRYKLSWRIDKKILNLLYNTSKFTSLYVITTKIFGITLNFCASFLPEGTISIFNYARNLHIKALSIFLTPVSNVFFSEFKNSINDSEETDFKMKIHDSLYLYIIIFSFSISTIVLYGNLVFEFIWIDKNDILKGDISTAHKMLALNFIGGIFIALSSLYRKSLIALNYASQLYTSWIAVQLFSALYAYFSIKYFQVIGLATIPAFNFIGLSFCTFILADKNNIPVFSLFKEILIKENLLGYILILFSFSFINTIILRNQIELQLVSYALFSIPIIIYFFKKI